MNFNGRKLKFTVCIQIRYEALNNKANPNIEELYKKNTIILKEAVLEVERAKKITKSR